MADDFYSTTNHRTYVRHGGAWLEVDHQRMDAVDRDRGRAGRHAASCATSRRATPSSAASSGIRVSPEFRERDRLGFAFMVNDVSTERRVEVSVSRVLAMLEGREAARADASRSWPGRSSSTAAACPTSPISSGAASSTCCWPATRSRCTTPSARCSAPRWGSTSNAGHRGRGGPPQSHARDQRGQPRWRPPAGGRSSGLLRSGILYEAIRHDVDYVLAGSIRDDGPLRDTIMNLIEAQDRYAEALRGVSMVVMLSTMLHSIGVGNMLPSHVRVVCVDINPAVVTKLADRGSSQTAGIVTDVGLFLHQLTAQLDAAARRAGRPRRGMRHDDGTGRRDARRGPEVRRHLRGNRGAHPRESPSAWPRPTRQSPAGRRAVGHGQDHGRAGGAGPRGLRRSAGREMDLLLATGEQVSVSLLGLALQHKGIPVISLTASQCGIRTDDAFNIARIESIDNAADSRAELDRGARGDHRRVPGHHPGPRGDDARPRRQRHNRGRRGGRDRAPASARSAPTWTAC